MRRELIILALAILIGWALMYATAMFVSASWWPLAGVFATWERSDRAFLVYLVVTIAFLSWLASMAFAALTKQKTP